MLPGHDLDFGTAENELLPAMLDGHLIVKTIGIAAGDFHLLSFCS